MIEMLNLADKDFNYDQYNQEKKMEAENKQVKRRKKLTKNCKYIKYMKGTIAH